MRSQEIIVYGVSAACAFIYGFVIPLVIPPEEYAKLMQIYHKATFGMIVDMILASALYAIVAGMLCCFVLI